MNLECSFSRSSAEVSRVCAAPIADSVCVTSEWRWFSAVRSTSDNSDCKSPTFFCSSETNFVWRTSTQWYATLPRSTQPSVPPGSVNEYQLRLGRQRQVWLIPIADERVGVQVKLWDPLRTRAIPERFCSGDSLWRSAISSVCTLTLTFTRGPTQFKKRNSPNCSLTFWHIPWTSQSWQVRFTYFIVGCSTLTTISFPSPLSGSDYATL